MVSSKRMPLKTAAAAAIALSSVMLAAAPADARCGCHHRVYHHRSYRHVHRPAGYYSGYAPSYYYGYGYAYPRVVVGCCYHRRYGYYWSRPYGYGPRYW